MVQNLNTLTSWWNASKITHTSPTLEIFYPKSQIPLKPIPDNLQRDDIEYHLKHKATEKFSEALAKIVTDDIHNGFALPLTIDIIKQIPNASLAPLGCHLQETINEFGERVPKYRMTHVQTFPGPSGKSVKMKSKRRFYLIACTVIYFTDCYTTLSTHNFDSHQLEYTCASST
jgi:hypothetical protein